MPYLSEQHTRTEQRQTQRARSLRTLLAPGSLLRFYLTLLRHSFFRSVLQEEGGASLLTAPPGRRIVLRIVVGDFDPTSSTGVDGVDLVVTVGCVPARIDYLVAAGRVGRLVVARIVVGEFEFTSPPGLMV